IGSPTRSDSASSHRCGAATRGDSCTIIWRRASTSPSPACRRKASTRAGSEGDGTIASSEISSACRRRGASTRAGKAGSSRRSSSTPLRSSRRSRSCVRRRIGGGPRGCGASRRPDSCRNGMRNSTTQTGSNRLEVSEQKVAVLLVLDPRANLSREGQMPPEVSLPPRDRVGPCQGFVGEGEREILDAVFIAHREGADCVIRRRLRSVEDGIDVRHLPLPDREIHRGSDLTPMKARRVRRVDHPVVFRRRALLLEEPPDLIEQPGGHLPMPFPLCRREFPCHGVPFAHPVPYVNRMEWGWADLNCRRRLPKPEG